MSDHEAIWLQCKCQEDAWDGRQWAENDAWGLCHQNKCLGSTKYIRADLYATLEAENARWRETIAALALTLGVGAGDETTTPEQYAKRIEQGIDLLVAGAVRMKETDIARLKAEIDVKQQAYMDVSDRNQDLAGENKRLKADKAKLVKTLSDYNYDFCEAHPTSEVCGQLDPYDCSGCKAARLLKEVG